MSVVFSICDADGAHLGFLAMQPDGPNAPTGSLMLRLNPADRRQRGSKAFATLSGLSQNLALPYVVSAAGELSFQDPGQGPRDVGSIVGAYMKYAGQVYELNEVSG